jgi:hypothetical protein
MLMKMPAGSKRGTQGSCPRRESQQQSGGIAKAAKPSDSVLTFRHKVFQNPACLVLSFAFISTAQQADMLQLGRCMICHLFHKPQSRVSSVSIVPRLEATRSRGKLFFSLTKNPDRFCGPPPPPPFHSVDTGGSFSRVKLPGREAAHSPNVTKIKNDWSYTSTFQYAFKTCTGTTLLQSTGTTPPSGGTL